jgi:DNA-binding winged helix-turn-helix (wHTH) protein
VATEGIAGPVSTSEAAVRLVRWPEERELLDRLRAEGTPRLLLLRPPAPAPEVMECEEDWVRLPADDGDVRARVLGLAARSSRHRPGPFVDESGRVRYGDRWIALSPIEHRLARVLAEHFGEVVPTSRLTHAAWPDEQANDGALRVHLTRLRRRLRPLELYVQNVRGRGYLLDTSVTDAADPSGKIPSRSVHTS